MTGQMSASMMKVPFLDLKVPVEERQILLEAIDQVFQHGRFILGPEVQQFESLMAKYCERKFAIGTGSGTDALLLGLKALGIGPGDEVITTALSWIATANTIAMTGATPVFADIGEDLNIDPQSVEKLITSKTKAIVPVHYTGKVSNIDALRVLASQYGLKIVEDAAQAFGAMYKRNPAGSFGDVACFSMNPMKVFAACGEAGVVLTDDESVYQRLLALRYNGTVNKEYCIATSLNCRLDTIQAAMLLQRFKNIESVIASRRKSAELYREALQDVVRVPVEQSYERDVYYTYQIQTPKRDALKQFLEERGIETKIQHPFLMCQQSIYQKYLHIPVVRAEKIVKEILCLPMHEKLSLPEQQHVIDSVMSFFDAAK